MKTFLFSLFLVPFATLCQIKKDNTLIGPPVPFNVLKDVLFQNGYNLSNDDTIYITTKSKELKKYPVSIKFMILRTDSNTVVTGLFSSNPADFSPLNYGSIRGSAYRREWEGFMISRPDSNKVVTDVFRPTVASELGAVSTGPADFSPLDYRGMRGSPYRRAAWEELDRVAKLLSPTVIYTKRKTVRKLN
jgi:hypothetical protein